MKQYTLVFQMSHILTHSIHYFISTESSCLDICPSTPQQYQAKVAEELPEYPGLKWMAEVNMLKT